MVPWTHESGPNGISICSAVFTAHPCAQTRTHKHKQCDICSNSPCLLHCVQTMWPKNGENEILNSMWLRCWCWSCSFNNDYGVFYCLLKQNGKTCLAVLFGEKHAATLSVGTKSRPLVQLSIYCVRSGQLGSFWKKNPTLGTSKSSLVIPIAALVQCSGKKMIFVNISVGFCWRSSVCRRMILVRIHSFNSYVYL